MGQALRMICEQLHPTGIDDPWACCRAAMQVEKVQVPGSARVGWSSSKRRARASANATGSAANHSRSAYECRQACQRHRLVVQLRYPDTPMVRFSWLFGQRRSGRRPSQERPFSGTEYGGKRACDGRDTPSFAGSRMVTRP